MAQDQVRSCAVALYGVTEQLKTKNQMKWGARMNNIRSMAIEVVNNELIYT